MRNIPPFSSSQLDGATHTSSGNLLTRVLHATRSPASAPQPIDMRWISSPPKTELQTLRPLSLKEEDFTETRLRSGGKDKLLVGKVNGWITVGSLASLWVIQSLRKIIDCSKFQWSDRGAKATHPLAINGWLYQPDVIWLALRKRPNVTMLPSL